jgi:hypothetical protein
MPTLGEFITHARAYGYTKHVIHLQELRARIVYLRRGQGNAAKLVDLPPIRESDRLTKGVVESLCDRAETTAATTNTQPPAPPYSSRSASAGSARAMRQAG